MCINESCILQGKIREKFLPSVNVFSITKSREEYWQTNLKNKQIKAITKVCYQGLKTLKAWFLMRPPNLTLKNSAKQTSWKKKH